MASLILRTQGGFANRVRAIVSAALWAEDLGRKLVVYWPVEVGHMPCSFEELLVASSIPGLCCVHAGYLTKAHQVLSEGDMRAVLQLFGGQDEIRIESYAEFHPDKDRRLCLLRNLRIQPVLEEIAEKLWAETGGKSSWTAIHFRGTDHVKCLTASPLEAFIGRIGSELEEDGRRKYILCTDEPGVAVLFKDSFGIPALITTRGRRQAEQQRLGVVDWLLLQKCGRILASAGSSFSELAAVRSGAELEVVSLENRNVQ